MNSPMIKYFLMKRRFHVLSEEISSAKNENDLNSIIARLKERIEKNEIEGNDEAIDVFAEIWTQQHSSSQRPIVVSSGKLVNYDLKGNDEEQEIPRRKIEKRIEYTYELANLLGYSILFMIRLHSHDAPEYVYKDIKEIVTTTLEQIKENKAEDSPSKLYSKLLAQQVRLFLIIESLDRNSP